MSLETVHSEYVPFFDHAERGVLAFPYCPACSRFHWYPMKRCPHCQADAIEWRPVDGRGRLYSWTDVRHPFGMRPKPPYIVALVEFDDAPGVRLITNLRAVSEATLRIGAAVRAVLPRRSGDPDDIVLFEPFDDGTTQRDEDRSGRVGPAGGPHGSRR